MTKKRIQTSVAKQNPWLLSALLISVLWSLIILWPHLTDWYRVPIDVQNHYWMAKFQDPTLFPGDRLQYQSSLTFLNIFGREIILYPRSFGHAFIFLLASVFVEPILFGKLLVFVLMPLAAVYLYQLAKNQTKNNKVALGVSILFVFFNLATPDSMSVASGLQRAFALPLLIIFMYYLMEDKYKIAAGLLPITALIYLPNVPLMVLTYVFSMVDFNDGKVAVDLRCEKVLPFVVGLFVAGLIALWALGVNFHLFDSTEASTLVKDVPFAENPLYQEGSATPLYLRFPWLGKAGLFDVDADAMNFLVLAVLSLAISLVVEKQKIYRLSKLFWSLLIAGFLMYFLALGAIFIFSSSAFYLPSRYTRITLFLIPFYFVGLNLREFIHALPAWMRKNKIALALFIVVLLFVLGILALVGSTATVVLGWIGLVITGFLVVFLLGLGARVLEKELASASLSIPRVIFAVILCLISLFPAGAYSKLVGFDTINPTEDERALYEFVATLPKSVVLAGSPEELTGIPLFSRRNVLFRSLFPDKSAPIIEAFDAYYAETVEKLVGFCEQYDIDYLVVNTTDFAEDYVSAGEFFFLPYNTAIQEFVSKREDFVLPQFESVFASGSLGVIKCDATSVH